MGRRGRKARRRRRRGGRKARRRRSRKGRKGRKGKKILKKKGGKGSGKGKKGGSGKKGGKKGDDDEKDFKEFATKCWNAGEECHESAEEGKPDRKACKFACRTCKPLHGFFEEEADLGKGAIGKFCKALRKKYGKKEKKGR